MGTQISLDELGEYPANFIRFKARQVIRKAGLSHHEIPELEQELWLDLLLRLKKFDHDQGELGAFVTRIVEQKVATMLRDQSRSISAQMVSLNDSVMTEEGIRVERIEQLQESSAESYGVLIGGNDENIDSRIDVARALDSLPKRLRLIAEQLAEQNVSQISRETDISRTTIYKAITEIRKIFQLAGLKDYVSDK